MDLAFIGWMLTLFVLAYIQITNALFARKNKTVVCQYEWCTFVVMAQRDQAELAYSAMNHHLLEEHGSGPWSNSAIPPSSD